MLQVPRATLPIPYRIPGIDTELSVRALRSIEEVAAFDIYGKLENDSQREDLVVRTLIANALLTPSGMAFNSAVDVGALSQGELGELGHAVVDALSIISPTFIGSDVDAWHATLKRGAGDVTNVYESMLLAESVDIAAGDGVRYTTPRLDRYFGMRIGEITDGQHMAYLAARSIVDAMKSSAENDSKSTR